MDIVKEFEGAELGDERLQRRLTDLGERLAERPDESLPKAMRTEAALEGAYRFLNHDEIEPEEILAPHVGRTVERCSEERQVIVAHDTTEVGFPTSRKGLGRVTDGPTGQGFFLHTALAVADTEQRQPLGVLGADTHIRTGRPKRKKGRHTENKPEPQRESARWWSLLEHVDRQLGPNTEAIHVLDREADNYLMMARAKQRGLRFVVRSQYDRRIEHEDMREPTLRHALEGLEGQLCRTVHVAPRHPKTPGKSAKARKRGNHSGKAGRAAKLEFRATTVSIRKPSTAPSTRFKLPETLTLSFVHVYEIDPPDDYEPVDWKLLSTEPIDTPEQVATIVDAYDARWVIEEYFKALKTGCALERRQLQSDRAIYNALAVLMPIAWSLLRIRHNARCAPDEPAHALLSPLHLRILQRHKDVKLGADPSLHQAWLAIAKLGGHLKRNGPPGWQTLAKGYFELLTLAEGAQLASGTCDQS